MIIGDIMSKNFEICSEKDTISEVMNKFLNTPSNMLPVIDEFGKLIGVITKNKILRVITQGTIVSETIEKFYTRNPVSLRPNIMEEDARKILLKHNIAHVPIVNEEMNPIGVLSTQEILSMYSAVYNQLKSVIDFAYDAIILMNNRGQIVMVNKSFTDLFTLSKEKVLYEYIDAILPELEMSKLIESGVSLTNAPQIINKQQCLISVIPIKEEEDINSYLCKISFRGLSHLQGALQKVKKLEQQVSYYKDEIYNRKGTKYTLFDIAGDSQVIRKVKTEAMLAAESMSTVLITGESGTGKELFAQGIHAESNQTGPFIEVNAAAIPDELLESELFGYEGGAFTGAKREGMKGKFELAQNGTIFLDEIAEMPLSLQAKLLRVLQEKEFRPLGSSKTIYLNTKIVAATNQNLEQLVAQKKFRQDLYYRLNVIRLEIPPLRDRIEDIPVIIETIVNRLNENGFNIKGVTHAAISKLMQHWWPGNVRELHNVLERAANLTTGDYIDADNITIMSNRELILDTPIEQPSSYKEQVKTTKKAAIIAALEEAEGNKSRASKLLGISRTWLYKKMKEYEIEQ